MTVRYLLGFLPFLHASSLSLQAGSHTLPICNGNDCHAQANVRNQSGVASGRFVCQCCWRDCDLHAEGTRDLKAEEGPSNGRLGIFDSNAPPVTWNVGDRADNIDAWLIMNGPLENAWGIYLPIVETVKDAIESVGGVVAVIDYRAATQQAMIEGVKVAAAQGRRPLVFTVGQEMQLAQMPEAFARLKQAKHAGAYLVAYQAEPGFDAHGSAIGRRQRLALDNALTMGADEVWDFTLANVKAYITGPNRPIVRYVPPGYVRKLDVGVDVNSKLMDTSGIGFMGQTDATTHFVKTMNDKYLSLFGDRLVESNNVWTSDDLRRFLETHPIQLNQHRWQTCCPREPWEAQFQQFESFRMASLLANKACVISGPSAEEDMKVWQGIVTFAEVEDTLSTFERLRTNLQACRQKSYETYKREFEPRALLSKSGFFEVWRPPHGV